jgi:hypothetical protein
MKNGEGDLTAEAVAGERQPGHGAERGGDQRGGRGDQDGVGQTSEQAAVVHREVVPSDREARHREGHHLGAIEREQRDHHDRQVHEGVDEPKVGFEEALHGRA